MLVLSVAALVVPALTAHLHKPAGGHEHMLSIIVSVLLLLLFAASLPQAIRRHTPQQDPDATSTSDERRTDEHGDRPRWPLWLAIVMLAVTGVGAAVVSDWFVTALTPTMHALHISQAFAGLVIVAIAGNAVENVVGVRLAYTNESDSALSVILQSPVQIAMTVAPVLVLLSPVVGASFTLVLPPLLLVALLLAVVVTVLVVFDGKSNWLEGAALITLYAVVATSFWWG